MILKKKYQCEKIGEMGYGEKTNFNCGGYAE